MGTPATLEEEYAILSVLIITGPALVVSRQWLLRNRTRTIAINITDSAVLICGMLTIVGAGLTLWNFIIEKRMRKTIDIDFLVFLTIVTDNYMKRYFIVGICNTVQLYLLKAGFLGHFAGLVSRSSRRSYVLYIGVCVYTAISFVAIITLQLSICYPISKNWDVTNLPQICFSYTDLKFNEVLVTLNVSTDILVLVVALIIISSLKLGRRERVALFLIAAIGFISISMCVIRFVQFYLVATATKTPDLKWNRNMTRWQALEIQLAIMAICLPAYRTLFVKFLKGGRSETESLTWDSEDARRSAHDWEAARVGYKVFNPVQGLGMDQSWGMRPPDTALVDMR